MNKIEKMLQCNDCKEKLNELCEALGYNDAEREVAAEVLLWLEMGKLKNGSIDIKKIADRALNASPPDATKPSVMWETDIDPNNWYTVKC